MEAPNISDVNVQVRIPPTKSVESEQTGGNMDLLNSKLHYTLGELNEFNTDLKPVNGEYKCDKTPSRVNNDRGFKELAALKNEFNFIKQIIESPARDRRRCIYNPNATKLVSTNEPEETELRNSCKTVERLKRDVHQWLIEFDAIKNSLLSDERVVDVHSAIDIPSVLEILKLLISLCDDVTRSLTAHLASHTARDSGIGNSVNSEVMDVKVD